MIAYYLLIGISILIYIFMFNMKNRDRYAICAFFFMFFGMLALRDISNGIDLKAYLHYFNRFSKYTWKQCWTSDELESGYILLNKIVSVFSENYQFLIYVVAAISVFPYAWLYMEEEGDAVLTIALFIIVAPFSMFFSGLRQVVAMAFVVPAYGFVKKKQIVPFIGCVILACLFHKSAFVVLLLYPAYHIKLKKSYIPLLILALAFAFLFRIEILTTGLKLIGGKYAENYGQIVDTGAYEMFLLFCVFLIYAYVIPSGKEHYLSSFEKNIDEYAGMFVGERIEDKELSGLRNILWLVAFIQVFASIHLTVMRINYYFLMLIPLLIPKIVKNGKDKLNKLTTLSYFVIVIFFISYFFYNAKTGEDILRIFPYVPFWEGGK